MLELGVYACVFVYILYNIQGKRVQCTLHAIQKLGIIKRQSDKKYTHTHTPTTVEANSKEVDVLRMKQKNIPSTSTDTHRKKNQHGEIANIFLFLIVQ